MKRRKALLYANRPVNHGVSIPVSLIVVVPSGKMAAFLATNRGSSQKASRRSTMDSAHAS